MPTFTKEQLDRFPLADLKATAKKLYALPLESMSEDQKTAYYMAMDLLEAKMPREEFDSFVDDELFTEEEKATFGLSTPVTMES
jgi:hypothetical protein